MFTASQWVTDCGGLDLKAKGLGSDNAEASGAAYGTTGTIGGEQQKQKPGRVEGVVVVVVVAIQRKNLSCQPMRTSLVVLYRKRSS